MAWELNLENENKWYFQSKFQSSGITERLSIVLDLPTDGARSLNSTPYPYYPTVYDGAYTFFDYAKDYLNLFQWLNKQAPEASISLDDYHYKDMYDLRLQLSNISQIIACRNELCGGLLIHGVMLEYNNKAIILAGESGRGKTTAAARVPDAFWKKHSDDLTLVVRDKEGHYFAHPWPGTKAYTHFEICYESAKGIPLSGVYYLIQDEEVIIQPLKPLEAFALTQEAANQAINLPDPSIDPVGVGEVRKNRLSSITQFIGKIPCYALHLDKTKPFWKEIEALI